MIEPVGVPPHPSQIRGLAVTVASSASDRALWNTLIAREHPRGLATFAGCQVRYLFGSEHGWLGAAGFSAAALRAAARDRWMAWSDERRRAHLNRVVGLSLAPKPRKTGTDAEMPALGAGPASLTLKHALRKTAGNPAALGNRRLFCQTLTTTGWRVTRQTHTSLRPACCHALKSPASRELFSVWS